MENGRDDAGRGTAYSVSPNPLGGYGGGDGASGGQGREGIGKRGRVACEGKSRWRTGGMTRGEG